MMDIIKKLFDAIIQFFKYKEAKEENDSNKNEKVDQLQKEAKEKGKEKEKDVEQAIKDKDEDAINAIINRKVKKVVKVLFLFVSLSILCGCVTKYVPVYVKEEEKVVYLENEGKPGYWVPEETMKKLLTYKVRYEAYLEAKGNVK